MPPTGFLVVSMTLNGIAVRALLLTCFFLSGASSLIYEVVWLRLLTLRFGSTALAVSAVLAAFMAGLALGSFLLGRVADRLAEPLLAYGIPELGIGLYALAVPAIFGQTEAIYIRAWSAPAPGVAEYSKG